MVQYPSPPFRSGLRFTASIRNDLYAEVTIRKSKTVHLNGVTPDYLAAVSASENKVLTGVLFQVTLAASVVAIPIVLFPILRMHHETLALAYVGARIFEGIADAAIALSQLLLLTLSREFVEAGYPPTKATNDEME